MECPKNTSTSGSAALSFSWLASDQAVPSIVVDSGSSDHMSGSNDFLNVVATEKTVQTAGEEKLSVTKKGVIFV